jgi:site-specific DNA-methyltransferase (adenine-specific)
MLWHGDALEVLAGLADASVDAVVTDPPYELGFMGRTWDASGIAYNVDLWKQCLRVLKPGGHLLAFGGTRTSHRLTCAIEDAGFEIRDSISWIFGQGFPKSLDVSKAIDKATDAEHAVIGQYQPPNGMWNLANDEATPGDGGTMGKFDRRSESMGITAPATDDAKRWAGWGTALKPAHEPIVVARKPLAGTVTANVLAHETGAINIDACRVPTSRQTLASDPKSAPGNAYMGSVDGSLNERQ